jgi:hypothetical protein
VSAALLATITSSAAVASRDGNVPGQVALGVMRAQSRGPIVVTGILRDQSGQPSAGRVALNVLPSQAENRKLRNGDALKTRTVGWAHVGADGNFSLRADPRRYDSRNVSAHGGISWEVVGWTGDRQGTTYVAGSVGDVSRVDVAATQPLLVASGSAPAADVRDPLGSAVTTCVWIQQSTFDVWVVIGQTWPYGSDTGWMKSSTSHSFTVGAATSASGTLGSWSANGTTSTESGITFTWAESVAYREYREEHRYGKFRLACAGRYTSDWASHELYGTGGYTTVSSANPGFTTHQVLVSAGVWERTRSDGSHFALSGGVKAAGVLGIDLSVDTNYNSTRTLSYRLVAAGKIFGDTNVPALAARVRTGR